MYRQLLRSKHKHGISLFFFNFSFVLFPIRRPMIREIQHNKEHSLNEDQLTGAWVDGRAHTVQNKRSVWEAPIVRQNEDDNTKMQNNIRDRGNWPYKVKSRRQSFPFYRLPHLRPYEHHNQHEMALPR